ASVAVCQLYALLLMGSAVKYSTPSRWRAPLAESFEQADAGGWSVDTVLNTTTYLQADVTTPDDWRALLEACQGQIFIYFALPPAISVTACQVLQTVGLPDDTRLMLEKPFGSDADSAAELNELVNRLVPEDQVHR